MRRKVRKICILLVTVFMLGMLAVPAGAATRKLINQKYTRQRAKAEAKARVVNLGTTTVVIPSKGRGYLKFTAPRTGKYSFSLWGLKSKKVKVKVQTTTTAASTSTASLKATSVSSKNSKSSKTSGKTTTAKTVTKVKTKKIRPFSNGYFYVMMKHPADPERIGQEPMETAGGQTNALWVANQVVQRGNQVGWRLKARTGLLLDEINAGETVYLYFNFTPGDRLKMKISMQQ